MRVAVLRRRIFDLFSLFLAGTGGKSLPVPAIRSAPVTFVGAAVGKPPSSPKNAANRFMFRFIDALIGSLEPLQAVRPLESRLTPPRPTQNPLLYSLNTAGQFSDLDEYLSPI